MRSKGSTSGSHKVRVRFSRTNQIPNSCKQGETGLNLSVSTLEPPGKEIMSFPDLLAYFPRLALPSWLACFPCGCGKFTAHKFCGAMSPERLPWQEGRHLAGCPGRFISPWHTGLVSPPSLFAHPEVTGHISVLSKAMPGRLGCLQGAWLPQLLGGDPYRDVYCLTSLGTRRKWVRGTLPQAGSGAPNSSYFLPQIQSRNWRGGQIKSAGFCVFHKCL